MNELFPSSAAGQFGRRQKRARGARVLDQLNIPAPFAKRWDGHMDKAETAED